MGRDANLACKTCRVNVKLGYGSYSTWIHADTLEEYDKAPDTFKHRYKNITLRKALVEHEGHDYVIWSHDWCSVVRGNLEDDVSQEILIENYESYHKITEELGG